MYLKILLQEIARAEYDNFRKYLNEGNDGLPLTCLDLSEELDDITDQPTFLEHLFAALLESQVENLDLSSNRIKNAGAIKIGEGIKSNIKIKELHLEYNDIDSEGAIGLLRNITYKHGLEGIYLFFNELYMFDDSLDVKRIRAFLNEEYNVISAIEQLPQPISEAILPHYLYVSEDLETYKVVNTFMPERHSLNGALDEIQKNYVSSVLFSQASQYFKSVQNPIPNQKNHAELMGSQESQQHEEATEIEHIHQGLKLFKLKE